MTFENIAKDIKSIKTELRKKSKNYRENFNQIKKYISLEIQEIKKLKNSKKSIIPEISFESIGKDNFELIKKIKRRGGILIREVFDLNVCHTLFCRMSWNIHFIAKKPQNYWLFIVKTSQFISLIFIAF